MVRTRRIARLAPGQFRAPPRLPPVELAARLAHIFQEIHLFSIQKAALQKRQGEWQALANPLKCPCMTTFRKNSIITAISAGATSPAMPAATLRARQEPCATQKRAANVRSFGYSAGAATGRRYKPIAARITAIPPITRRNPARGRRHGRAIGKKSIGRRF